MTNCLKLLRVGGVFKILVPYDLSYGAWQDPTHIRAFNERSWLYTRLVLVTGLDRASHLGPQSELRAKSARRATDRRRPAAGVGAAHAARDRFQLVILEKFALSAQDRQGVGRVQRREVRNQALVASAA